MLKMRLRTPWQTNLKLGSYFLIEMVFPSYVMMSVSPPSPPLPPPPPSPPSPLSPLPPPPSLLPPPSSSLLLPPVQTLLLQCVYRMTTGGVLTEKGGGNGGSEGHRKMAAALSHILTPSDTVNTGACMHVQIHTCTCTPEDTRLPVM